MGWTHPTLRRIRSGSLGLLAAGLLAVSAEALAQTTNNIIVTSVTNGYTRLDVVDNAGLGVSFRVVTAGSNETNPSRQLMASGSPAFRESKPYILGYALAGSQLQVRVNGGLSSVYQNGYDYTFGQWAQTTTGGNNNNNLVNRICDNFVGFVRPGCWVEPPTSKGTSITAIWRTQEFILGNNTGGGGTGGGGGGTGGGGGGTGSLLVSHDLTIGMVATLVGESVRFQFEVLNNQGGTAPPVGLAFVQDITVSPQYSDTNGVVVSAGPDGPLRLEGGRYLRKETWLVGSQIPKYWEAIAPIRAATVGQGAQYQAIRGTLRPQVGLGDEPTPPSRLLFARMQALMGGSCPRPGPNDPQVIFLPSDCLWNYVPDPQFNLDTTGVQDAGVALFWDPQPLTAALPRRYVTYFGGASSQSDLRPPLSVNLVAPRGLSLITDNSTTPAKCTVTPNPFTIRATIRNSFDALGGTSSIGPITAFLDLPKGLKLASGSPQQQSIPPLGPGGESQASWTVMVDSDSPISGALQYTVTVSAGNQGRTVSGKIEVPAPVSYNLVGNNLAKGKFQMITLPVVVGSALPSEVLGLSNTPPDFDLVRWNQAARRYDPVTLFIPGQAYWLRSKLPDNKTVVVDCLKYSPLANQVLPTVQTYTIPLQRGWNQIGNPYVFALRFSEVLMTDGESILPISTVEAADVTRQWIIPAIWRYNTSNPDPTQWDYVTQDDFGMTLPPLDGFWIYARKDGLSLLFNGVDTPGVTVTRSAQNRGLGPQLGRNTANNWRLALRAQGQESRDNAAIGVAPKATDGPDIYKYDKPPMMANQITLDIIHSDWKEGSGRYVQDLRAPSAGKKTWELLVRGTHSEEEVTLTWPDIAASVPRNVQLFLVDKETNTRLNLRNASSFAVKTGKDATRKVEIVAEGGRTRGRVLITSLNVVPGTRESGRAATSATIHYSLSQSADTRLFIRDAQGRSLRTLNAASTRAAEGDTANGSVVWDLKDSKGVTLPNGVYSIELMAVGTDGQRARQVRPYLITR